MIMNSGKDVPHVKIMMYWTELTGKCAFAQGCFMNHKKNEKMKKIILAYSGGLDTSYCLKKLSSEGNEVHAVCINTGGFKKSELKTNENKALKLGAFKYKTIDAVEIYYNKIIKYLICFCI